jgi:sulfur relay (sulfurtransferase) DsrF/TusC family protein
MGKTLNVVERAYHATLEEQDDVALWFALAMKVQGNLEQSILLRGNAVNYLVKTQDAGGLKIGDIALDPPPKIVEDLELLKSKGLALYAVEEDLAKRGVPKDRLIGGVEIIKKSGIAKLFNDHDRIYYW